MSTPQISHAGATFEKTRENTWGAARFMPRSLHFGISSTGMGVLWSVPRKKASRVHMNFEFPRKKRSRVQLSFEFPRQARGCLGPGWGRFWAPFLTQMMFYYRKIRVRILQIKRKRVLTRKIRVNVYCLTPRRHIYDSCFARSEVYFDMYFTIQSADLHDYRKCL